MSNLPAKPEFSRTANARPEPGDERRPSGRASSPDRYPYSRDDRDRDARERERERGSRSRYGPSGQRSPLPSRSGDTYISGSRDSYHGREYQGYDDGRARDDRRKDWDRDRDRDNRDRDRERGYYRRDDAWPPRNDYCPNRASLSRRGYGPRDGDWRGRDDYRRERNRERGRSGERDEPRSRDRERDRRHGSPIYRPAPLSPRRDYHYDRHSSPRRPAPTYPSRARRSTSPRSTGNRSHRSSPVPRARAEPYPPRDIPRPPKSPSPRRASPSPKPYTRSGPSPARTESERQPDETVEREVHHPEEPRTDDVKVEEPPVECVDIIDGQMDVKIATEPPIKGEERSEHVDEELHGKAERMGSPTECHQQLISSRDAVGMGSSEAGATKPYLPVIPRHEAKPRFSAAYESEYDRLEGHRAHAAAECRRCMKASRRAIHELEMATLDLRAAQHRRELAESHRKKAHHGQLGIDAESVVNK